jgi:hypothetical protein
MHHRPSHRSTRRLASLAPAGLGRPPTQDPSAPINTPTKQPNEPPIVCEHVSSLDHDKQRVCACAYACMWCAHALVLADSSDSACRRRAASMDRHTRRRSTSFRHVDVREWCVRLCDWCCVVDFAMLACRCDSSDAMKCATTRGASTSELRRCNRIDSQITRRQERTKGQQNNS